VLARPLCWRGSLPLHALVHLLWDFHFALGIVAVRNLPPDVRSPNRRHHSRAPNEVPHANILRSHQPSQISVCQARGEISVPHGETTTMASSWRNIQDDDDDDEEEFRPEVRPRDVAGVTQPRQTRNPPP